MKMLAHDRNPQKDILFRVGWGLVSRLRMEQGKAAPYAVREMLVLPKSEGIQTSFLLWSPWLNISTLQRVAAGLVSAGGEATFIIGNAKEPFLRI